MNLRFFLFYTTILTFFFLTYRHPSIIIYVAKSLFVGITRIHYYYVMSMANNRSDSTPVSFNQLRYTVHSSWPGVQFLLILLFKYYTLLDVLLVRYYVYEYMYVIKLYAAVSFMHKALFRRRFKRNETFSKTVLSTLLSQAQTALLFKSKTFCSVSSAGWSFELVLSIVSTSARV